MLGQKDRALGLLESAFAERSFDLEYILQDPLLRSLHGEPRFMALIEKLGIPQRTGADAAAS